MSEVAFQTKLYLIELSTDEDGELVFEIFGDFVDEDEEERDEEAQLVFTRAEAQTLGELLLRYAATGDVAP
jgi:hypothetical protein